MEFTDPLQEEKLRHQKQYPDYRYQPKRNGRNNSLSNSLPSAASAGGSDDRRCPKCGGRSITTPMSGSNLPTGAGNPPSTPYSPNHPASTPLTGSSAHRFLHSLGSPPANGSPGGLRSRPTTSAGNLSAQQLASPRFTHGDSMAFPLSPDLKRRRIVNGTHPAVRTANGPLTPFPFPQGHRRGSLPRPEFMPSQGHSKQHNMGPPPRPNHWDTSLTLAPLQMGSPNPGSTASKHSKSIEAMLMAIPPINKIRLLAKISPPLSQPDPGSPAEKARGFVISVDGADDASVAQVTETLLMSFPRNPVRVFERPLDLFHSESTGTVDDDTDEFGSCITAIAKYHILSKEIISYITTPATSAAYTTSPSTSVSPVSPKTMPLSKQSMRSSVHQVSDDESANIPTGVPIAVVPSFQLSHTDTFASRVHITDAYAPVDHWQWMATLWRGIVGPDITIAILPPPTPQSSTSAKSGSEMSKSMSARGTPRGNVSCGSGVEIRLEDARAILVRVDEKGVGEGSLRRVGFEVGEWVRSKEEGGRGN